MWRRNFFDIDPLQDFDEMEREAFRMFDQLRHLPNNLPKELVKEYQTPEGAKVKEVGPIVYGYSMTIGPDGKPTIHEFGNVKPAKRGRIDIDGTITAPAAAQLSSEREPLADISMTDDKVTVVLEMPGVKKEDIRVNASEGYLEVLSNNPQRRYHKTLELPKEADIETARSTYNNGILEITFNKKEVTKSKGKTIKIE